MRELGGQRGILSDLVGFEMNVLYFHEVPWPLFDARTSTNGAVPLGVAVY
jgi:hypothetical protein